MDDSIRIVSVVGAAFPPRGALSCEARVGFTRLELDADGGVVDGDDLTTLNSCRQASRRRCCEYSTVAKMIVVPFERSHGIGGLLPERPLLVLPARRLQYVVLDDQVVVIAHPPAVRVAAIAHQVAMHRH